MLANKGVTVLAISLDAKPPCVLVTSPDGWEEICPIKKWFKNGDPPKEVGSPLLADIATFEVLGVNEAGEAVMVRYDVKLQGMGPPIPRNADGSFGSKAGRRLEERLQAKPAQLPAVFDKEGMS